MFRHLFRWIARHSPYQTWVQSLNALLKHQSLISLFDYWTDFESKLNFLSKCFKIHDVIDAKLYVNRLKWKIAIILSVCWVRAQHLLDSSIIRSVNWKTYDLIRDLYDLLLTIGKWIALWLMACLGLRTKRALFPTK